MEEIAGSFFDNYEEGFLEYLEVHKAQALKDREDYQILNKKISELKYKYPNVRTFLEEKEPIDLRNDEQYTMLNVLDYETEQAEQVDSKANNLDNLSSLGKLLSKNFGQIQPNKNLKVI